MEPTIKFEDVKLGDFLTPDGGFDCMSAGVELEVLQYSEGGKLYVQCAADGGHLLEGQVDAHGNLLGFTKHRKSSDPV